jgi:predicted Zn-dependent protease
MKWKQILSVLLILSLMFELSKFSQAQAQAQYSLNLQRITWNRSTISVLLTPPNNESWWTPPYLNATLRAISAWNQAILDFASNYTDYAYLSKLRMTPTIAYTVDSGFNVYISWTETLPSAANEIGYTNTSYTVPYGIIRKSTIYLASETLQGYVLNEVDMQNLALHEMGHSLGLNHSNFTDDIMYPRLTMNPLNQVQGLSTLDLYGVSTVFQWMSNSSNHPYSPQQSSVTLPSNITYRYLPISNEDLPPASPYSSLWQTLLTYIQKLISYTTGLVTRPEVLTILVVILVLLVIAFLSARPQKAKKT